MKIERTVRVFDVDNHKPCWAAFTYVPIEYIPGIGADEMTDELCLKVGKDLLESLLKNKPIDLTFDLIIKTAVERNRKLLEESENGK